MEARHLHTGTTCTQVRLRRSGDEHVSVQVKSKMRCRHTLQARQGAGSTGCWAAQGVTRDWSPQGAIKYHSHCQDCACLLVVFSQCKAALQLRTCCDSQSWPHCRAVCQLHWLQPTVRILSGVCCTPGARGRACATHICTCSITVTASVRRTRPCWRATAQMHCLAKRVLSAVCRQGCRQLSDCFGI